MSSTPPAIPRVGPQRKQGPDAPIVRLRENGWGPGQTEPAGLAEARAYVERLTLSTYENFSVLSRFVPANIRPALAAVYAYCRWSDDLADEAGDLIGSDATSDEVRAESTRLLAWWRRGLARCFDAADADGEAIEVDGSVMHPVYVALCDTVRTHGLTREPFEDLLDAFEQDQRVTRYQTWDELIAYCSKSANPVGRIVLRLAGKVPSEREPANASIERMSDEVCTGLQLVNFWQDVRRDLLERDRVYLPQAETGLAAKTLRDFVRRGNDPSARVPYIRAVRSLAARTRPCFDHLDPLCADLGGWAGRVVWLLGSGGLSVLNKIERIGCTTLWKRPRLSKLDKAILIARSGMRQPTKTGGGAS